MRTEELVRRLTNLADGDYYRVWHLLGTLRLKLHRTPRLEELVEAIRATPEEGTQA